MVCKPCKERKIKKSHFLRVDKVYMFVLYNYKTNIIIVMIIIIINHVQVKHISAK